MVAEVALIKREDGALIHAANIDIETLANWKVGSAYKVKAIKMNPRALDFHRLYWAGLIGLTLDYWEPAGGLIGPSERKVLNGLIAYGRTTGLNSDGLGQFIKHYVNDLKRSRAGKVEVPHKSKESLHEWIKEEVGLYDLVLTPKGTKRVTKSINFNAMSEEQFRAFYKKAFSVCWNFILTKTFDDEAQAEQAINQLIAMG